MQDSLRHTDVLLLAAGFGKRLRPLTEVTPKPAVEVGGKSLIERHLLKLHQEGASRVFINLHHLADALEKHLLKLTNVPELVLVREERILDTGGAVKNIERRLQNEQLLVINSDILLGQDFSYLTLLNSHIGSSDLPITTLQLRADKRAKEFGAIEIDESGKIVSFLGQRAPNASPGRELMFLGVSLLERRLLELMPAEGTAFSLTRDTFLNAFVSGERLCGVVYEGYWSDIGTPERLSAARQAYPMG